MVLKRIFGRKRDVERLAYRGAAKLALFARYN
jgi:hypothetical protein